MLLLNHRKILIKKNNQLSEFKVMYPYESSKSDWYTDAYLDDQFLIASLASYSEEQQKKDSSTSMGGFKRGPETVGIIIVDLNNKKQKLYRSFKVSNFEDFINKEQIKQDKQKASAANSNVEKFTPSFQSALRDENYLYMAGYGQLTKLDLRNFKLELLKVDDFSFAMLVTRECLYKDGNQIWYCANEGGLDGAWIVTLDLPTHKESKIYPLNYVYLYTNSILKYKGNIYCSSLAGLLEINEKGETVTHFKFGNDPKKMGVYSAQVIKDHIWANREDGVVKYDIENKKVMHYDFKNSEYSNDIYALHLVKDKLYIATKSEVLVTDLDQF